jgi:hypothetical protein
MAKKAGEPSQLVGDAGIVVEGLLYSWHSFSGK